MTMYNLYYQCDDKQTMSHHQNSSKIQSENSRSEDTYMHERPFPLLVQVLK